MSNLGAKILVNLFYPQVDALINLAYEDFLMSDQYDRLAKFQDHEKITEVFFMFHLEDYMEKQLKENFLRVAFMPWTVLRHPDLYVKKFEVQ